MRGEKSGADTSAGNLLLDMLIGLAAENAILIVEFAKLEHEKGEPHL